MKYIFAPKYIFLKFDFSLNWAISLQKNSEM